MSHIRFQFGALRLAGFFTALVLTTSVVSAEVLPVAPVVAKPVIPTNTINFADFGCGDGKTFNTVAFEKAFAALAEKGGGRLVVPPGLWLTGPIQLRSNVELHVERGALIQFSGDYKLYPLTVINLKGEQEVDSTSPISGENLENVAITGGGVRTEQGTRGE